ncbi:MAG: stringent starvation protein A [Gammaproteobacteria bacterium]|nr:stringent starvation protein A [Gammaproteobacteria bacterium]|tara:strand:- start:528 stop:1166 length:639 start_codon:yes stop_codon:yes gene_type:complete
MVSLSRRTSMALFSDPNDHYCQRVRIVLEEKGISSEIITSDRNNLSGEILELSPYASVPLLVDRDVCLYDSVILMEYLDERFPHPPLLPVYPISRAHIRLYIKRIENDWCSLFDELLNLNPKEAKAKKTRQSLKALILGSTPIFKEKAYFMNEEFSLVDCCIAPILWRLPLVGIDIPNDAKSKPINEYMKRVFTRKSFLESLSETEREIRSV